MKMIKKTLGLNVEDPKYYIKLIIEAILIGLFSGFVVSLYRFGLDNSENILSHILKYIQGDLMLT
ncbi:MAG: ClC family H(+)/Cl(-) exchange transporter, partial [Methanobrevibacter sp.]|nr:ClC family H(+)/Cl(-) exchange transporter [Methanobrevibacter sp.]